MRGWCGVAFWQDGSQGFRTLARHRRTRLGLYGIPTAWEGLKPDESEAAGVLNAALDLGINLLDTARAYGDAEQIIGRVLKNKRNEF